MGNAFCHILLATTVLITLCLAPPPDTVEGVLRHLGLMDCADKLASEKYEFRDLPISEPEDLEEIGLTPEQARRIVTHFHPTNKGAPKVIGVKNTPVQPQQSPEERLREELLRDQRLREERLREELRREQILKEEIYREATGREEIRNEERLREESLTEERLKEQRLREQRLREEKQREERQREERRREERRLRAATLFCLRRQGLPANVLDQVAASTHRTQNALGQRFDDCGFFPPLTFAMLSVNAWKDLSFAFRRTPRTEALFSIIDRYESVIEAFRGGNDGPMIGRTSSSAQSQTLERSSSDEVAPTSIMIHKDGYIEHLSVPGLHDDDIYLVSYMPKRMTSLDLPDGSLTGMDVSKLPRGLMYLHLENNEINKMSLKSSPPNLRMLDLRGNPLVKDGVALEVPVPFLLRLKMPNIDAVHLIGGQKRHYTERKWVVTWNDRAYHDTWIEIGQQTNHVDPAKKIPGSD